MEPAVIVLRRKRRKEKSSVAQHVSATIINYRGVTDLGIIPKTTVFGRVPFIEITLKTGYFFVLPYSAVDSLKNFVLQKIMFVLQCSPLSFMFVTPMSTCCPPFLPHKDDDDNDGDNDDDNED